MSGESGAAIVCPAAVPECSSPHPYQSAPLSSMTPYQDQGRLCKHYTICICIEGSLRPDCSGTKEGTSRRRSLCTEGEGRGKGQKLWLRFAWLWSRLLDWAACLFACSTLREVGRACRGWRRRHTSKNTPADTSLQRVCVRFVGRWGSCSHLVADTRTRKGLVGVIEAQAPAPHAARGQSVRG